MAVSKKALWEDYIVLFSKHNRRNPNFGKEKRRKPESVKL